MNLVLGFPETMGLEQWRCFPKGGMESDCQTAKRSLLPGLRAPDPGQNFALFSGAAAKGCRDISRAAPWRSPLRAWRNW